MTAHRLNRRVLAALLIMAVAVAMANLAAGYIMEDALRRQRYAPDPLCGYRLRVGAADVNAEGIREAALAPRASHELRVLCMGGTMAAGGDVTRSQRLSGQLEAFLRGRLRSPLRVIDGAIEGYDLLNMRMLLEELWPVYLPDAVVVCFRQCPTYTYRTPDPLKDPVTMARMALHARLERSALVQALMLAVRPSHSFFGWPCELRGRSAPAGFTMGCDLDAFNAFSEWRGVPVLFVLEPAVDGQAPLDPSVRDAIFAHTDGLGNAVLPVDGHFASDGRGHLTAAGYREMGRRIGRALLQRRGWDRHG